MKRDVFLCHAGEDKRNVVTPLAEALENQGVKCWVDEGEIKWGDSITQKVNEGLKISQYVIVVLSESFLGKHWPERELYAALNIEASTGKVKVLPLLVGDKRAKERILNQYPLLNDKAYLSWEGKVKPIVKATIDLLSLTRKPSSENDNAMESSSSSISVPLPRIRNQFSDRDRDLFLKKAFNEVKNYFQRALDQLNKEYAEIDTDFSEVTQSKFVSKVYLSGDTKCQCKIWMGGAFTSDGIAYSEGRINIDQDNSYNELITVESDGYKLYLRFLMGTMYLQGTENIYDPSDAAELLWSRFVAPLES